MSPARSMHLASTFAVDERVGTRERRVGDEDRLGRTHRERGAQAGDLVVRGHRDQRDLATARGVDELQRHLDAVAVGLVEDELAAAVERVVGRERARHSRVGNLLDADGDVHATPVRGREPARGRRSEEPRFCQSPRHGVETCPRGSGPRPGGPAPTRRDRRSERVARGAPDRRPARYRRRRWPSTSTSSWWAPGPAGTAAAITAVEHGLSVVCVDKAQFPRDKTCGDGLTANALRLLERLGVSTADLAATDAAVRARDRARLAERPPGPAPAARPTAPTPRS